MFLLPSWRLIKTSYKNTPRDPCRGTTCTAVTRTRTGSAAAAVDRLWLFRFSPPPQWTQHQETNWWVEHSGSCRERYPPIRSPHRTRNSGPRSSMLDQSFFLRNVVTRRWGCTYCLVTNGRPRAVRRVQVWGLPADRPQGCKRMFSGGLRERAASSLCFETGPRN